MWIKQCGLDRLIEIVTFEQGLECGNLLKREEIFYIEKQSTSKRVFWISFLSTIQMKLRVFCFFLIAYSFAKPTYKNLVSLVCIYPWLLLLSAVFIFSNMLDNFQLQGCSSQSPNFHSDQRRPLLLESILFSFWSIVSVC